jgi:hypothetical protein
MAYCEDGRTFQLAENALGEKVPVCVDWFGHPVDSWGRKYFTLDCHQCPNHIPREVASFVFPYVYALKGRHRWPVPINHQGLCTWSQPRFVRILIAPEDHKQTKCQLFGRTPEEREQKRSEPWAETHPKNGEVVNPKPKGGEWQTLI